MAETENTSADYSKLSTEELQQLLRELDNDPDEIADFTQLRGILEELARRRQEKNPRVALKEFQQYYLEEDVLVGIKCNGTWLQRLIATIAIVVLVLFAGFSTVKACGFDVMAVFVKWTENGFFLSKNPDATVSLEDAYESCTAYWGLTHMLETNGVTEKLVPRWIPAGFSGEDVRMEETALQRKFYARYESDRGAMLISIVEYVEDAPTVMEHDNVIYETYEKDGIVYFITSNGNYLRAAWLTDAYVCNIYGPFTGEELKQIMDSIG